MGFVRGEDRSQPAFTAMAMALDSQGKAHLVATKP
jgi:hypothetical protein